MRLLLPLLLGCAATSNSGSSGSGVPQPEANGACVAVAETCNGVDDDCDGLVDGQDPSASGVLQAWSDADGDGYGIHDLAVCAFGEGAAAEKGDCDDADAGVNPGAEEVCDGLDDDCDGFVDNPVLACGQAGCGLQPVSCAAATWSGAIVGVVAGAGDVDGDGYADVILGEGGYSYDPGAAWLLLGGPEAGDLSLDAADAVWVGEDDEALGSSVAGAGDVNGDGFDDLVIGAPAAGGTGAVALVLGGPSAPAGGGLETADARFWGEAEDDYAGRSVAGAGDVDGDGFDDMVVSARIFYDAEGVYTPGRAYLVRGGASVGDRSLADADAVYWSHDEGSEAAQVAGAGDFDGDGLADLLIGAPYVDACESVGGVVYLVEGDPEPTDLVPAEEAIAYCGAYPWEEAGTSVAGAGDVNGDGFSDVIIGAPWNDEGGSRAGAAWLVLGRAEPVGGPLPELGVAYLGQGDYAVAGTSVDGAGDLDGDGFDDLVIGAPGSDAAGMNRGAVYVVLGGPAPAGRSLAAADTAYGGAAEYDELGGAVAELGDVDGDGSLDIGIAVAKYNGGDAYRVSPYGYDGGDAYPVSPYGYNGGDAYPVSPDGGEDPGCACASATPHSGARVASVPLLALALLLRRRQPGARAREGKAWAIKLFA